MCGVVCIVSGVVRKSAYTEKSVGRVRLTTEYMYHSPCTISRSLLVASPPFVFHCGGVFFFCFLWSGDGLCVPQGCYRCCLPLGYGNGHSYVGGVLGCHLLQLTPGFVSSEGSASWHAFWERPAG